MSTNRQGFFDNFTASRTFLRSVIRRNGYNLFSLFNRLIFQLEQKIIPSGVIDRFVQTSLDRSPIRQELTVLIRDRFRSAGHIVNVQIFVANYISGFQQIICSLMQKVVSLATNFVMTFLDCPKQLLILWRSFLCFGKPPLQTIQFRLRSSQILRR